MRRYDTTFILNPQIGDDRIDAHVKTVTSMITGAKGEILRENQLRNLRPALRLSSSNQQPT